MKKIKVYYYLILNKDFLNDDMTKKLEEQEHGKDFIILYLTLCLKSLENEKIIIQCAGDKLISCDTVAISKITNTNIGVQHLYKS